MAMEFPGQLLNDYAGRRIRLTNERLNHILEHPEMAGLEGAIAETLADPQSVVRSRSDPEVSLYYSLQRDTSVGDKYLCVVVRALPESAFIITAYVTDTIKGGELLWPRKS